MLNAKLFKLRFRKRLFAIVEETKALERRGSSNNPKLVTEKRIRLNSRQRFPVWTLHVVLTALVVVSLFYGLSFDLTVYKAIVWYSDKIFAVPNRFEVQAIRITSLTLNQALENSNIPVSETPSALIQSVSELHYEDLQLFDDALGYTALTTQFVNKALNYPICRLDQAEEFIEILNFCQSFKKNLVYKNTISLQSQSQLSDQTGSAQYNGLNIPYETDNWGTTTDFQVSVINLLNHGKKLLIGNLVKLRLQEFAGNRTSGADLEAFLMNAIDRINYLFYSLDFMHHFHVCLKD